MFIGGLGEVHSSADRVTEISQCMAFYILHCVTYSMLLVLHNVLIVLLASLRFKESSF